MSRISDNIDKEKCVKISDTIECSDNIRSDKLTPNEEKLVIGVYSTMKKSERKKCPGCGKRIDPKLFAKELVQSMSKYNTRSTILTVTDLAQLVREVKSLNPYSALKEARDLKSSIHKIAKSFGCSNMEKYNGLTTLESYFIKDDGEEIWHQDCHPSEPYEGYSESCEHDEHMRDKPTDFQ